MHERYRDDSFALHTDLYQINMVQVYRKQGIDRRKSVFDIYFRKLPFGNGYAVFAGLERMVEYIENFRVSDEDAAYLREELGYPADFVEYLQTIRFTGELQSVREGELVFGNEPLVRVTAPLAEAQLIETALLNIVNYQTLIATKAARMKQVIGDQPAYEFGSRRAHEMDAALWGARAACIAGFDGTSNVRAGKRFGVPVSGTHAHAFVQAYNDEYAAFKAYASTHRDCVFLVDTYDTLKSGVPNAIRVAKEMGDKIRFVGIRLDSGDLAYLSKRARIMLDEAGFPDAKIIASNDLDEYTIINLRAQGAKIDGWGIGTKLITAYDNAALGAVYKLAAIEDEQGQMRDVIKISSNPEKTTTPGVKEVFRIVNRDTGKAEGDYIALAGEDPNEEKSLTLFNPIHTYIRKVVTRFEARKLHVPVFQDGRRVYELPAMKEIREFASRNMDLLWDEYKRSLLPEVYPVVLSKRCWENRLHLIEANRKEE